MRLIWLLTPILTISNALAVIHKKTEYFVDIELSNKQFRIDCSGGPKDDNSIVGFHLLDGDTYYLFYYRRVVTVKQCHQLRKEYMDIIKDSDTVRIVGNHPDEEVQVDSDRKKSPAPFNKAKKIIDSFFIRLQVGNKCKAYFSEHCDLPKNYWGGVTPGK